MENTNKKYVLGLDIGISSVGWGLIELNENNEPYKIKDTGVRIFSPGENVKTGESKNIARREKRGTRRILRRRKFRINRIRYLLAEYNFLKKSNKNVISDIYEDLKEQYNTLIDNYYKEKDINPFELKTEALNRKLSNEELAIILVHYAKHRGYKSNRDEDNDDSGKVKSSIKENEKIMHEKNYRTISEMFALDEKFNDRIHNTTGDYRMSVNREMVLNDIENVLNCQIKFGLIDEKFKEEYIKIWSSQRHYSKGPGGNSKYGGNLIEKMTGTCKYTGEPRAPKQAPSTEIFNALTLMVNLRYKSNENYEKLTEEEINKILELALTKDSVTYKNLKEILDKETITIKGLELSKKEWIDCLNNFKVKILKLEKNDEVNLNELTKEEQEKFEKIKQEKLFSKKFIELKTTSAFRKEFSRAFGKNIWEKLLNNIEILDEIAVILTNYKTEEDIIEQVENSEIIDNNLIECILHLPNLKDHNNLSLSLIRNLNKLMKTGMLYNEAMSELGYNFSDLTINKEKFDTLLPINPENEISNQRVIRSLAQTRRIINAIIKKYGMPYKINIETARELAKSLDERKKIKRNQEENKENNDKIKKELCELLPNKFQNENKVSSFDLLKYKLWKEQQNICPYSLEKITIEELYDNGIVQVDHILPYSRTFDDSYFNKTLVKAKENQIKGNRTPYEWFKSDRERWENYPMYKSYINSLNIPDKKKDNYLLTNLTQEIENEMRNQNLNDTKYITRYLTSFLKAYLNVPLVDSVNGTITSKLRTRWGLNNITHSLQSPSYYIKDVDIENEIKKNRENHLHHAMDACIIACSNKSIIQKITNYEKYKRYFENKVDVSIESLLKNNYIYKSEETDDYIDEETGEIIKTESLEEYYKDLIDNNYLVKNNKNRYTVLFPQPYENFTNELKARIFERNESQQRFMLEGLHTYTKDELEEVKPLIPVIAKNKIKGSLHEETVYGYKKNENQEYITKRVSVTASNFKQKDLEQIIDKDNGSKEVYETLKKWMENCENGEIAYKNNGYPIDKTGKTIKKVKLQLPYEGKGHNINGKIVEKEKIQKILVFQDKEINALYFCGLDRFDILNLKKNKDYVIALWKSRSASEKETYNNLLNKYNLKLELSKNDFVEIEKENGNKCYCYINGFTSGKIDIGSYIGDNYDIVGENNLFDSFYPAGQYPLTITTIKDIKKIKLNTLGKIE